MTIPATGALLAAVAGAVDGVAASSDVNHGRTGLSARATQFQGAAIVLAYADMYVGPRSLRAYASPLLLSAVGLLTRRLAFGFASGGAPRAQGYAAPSATNLTEWNSPEVQPPGVHTQVDRTQRVIGVPWTDESPGNPNDVRNPVYGDPRAQPRAQAPGIL